MTIYGTLAASNTYHADRGNVAWGDAESDDLLNAALLRASEWIDARYSSRFEGWKTGRRSQVRSWPRSAAYDVEGEPIPSDEIPDEIERATYEAALRELITPGSLSPDVTPGQRVRSTSEAVGPLKEATEYVVAGDAIDAQRPVLTIVEGILAPLIRAKSNVSFVERA